MRSGIDGLKGKNNLGREVDGIIGVFDNGAYCGGRNARREFLGDMILVMDIWNRRLCSPG